MPRRKSCAYLLPLVIAAGTTLVIAQEAPQNSSRGERDTQPAVQMRRGEIVHDCAVCPEMVVIPPGRLEMGSQPGDLVEPNEQPVHRVTFKDSFAVGRYAVTFDEWDACVGDGACGGHRRSDYGWGRGRQPLVDVSWYDAVQYAAWLTQKTGQPYRLLSESEREYVTRAGEATSYWWGTEPSNSMANFRATLPATPDADLRPRPVGSFAPNPWGVFEVHGNVYEWVQDCWHDNYVGAPDDGGARLALDCAARVLRGGSWNRPAEAMRAQARIFSYPERRMNRIGLRVARPWKSSIEDQLLAIAGNFARTADEPLRKRRQRSAFDSDKSNWRGRRRDFDRENFQAYVLAAESHHRRWYKAEPPTRFDQPHIEVKRYRQ